MPSSERKKPISQNRRKAQPETDQQPQPPSPNNFVITGIAFVVLSVILFISIFYPVIRAELSYSFSGNGNVKVAGKSETMVPSGNSSNIKIVKPIDENFGIVIPKIGVNSIVVPDVDPENAAVYQKALTQGAAHALGTKHPGEAGNIFVFAHSGQDLLQAIRYNAVFYLLSKLETGDEIDIFYKNKKYLYAVTGKKTASSEEVQYLDDTPGKNTITLMTCWPAGTTWKRLIVVAEER